MRLFFPALLLAASLVGCAHTSAGSSQPGAQLSYSQDVYAAEQVLETTEQLATSYVQLPLCGAPTSPVLCSEASVSDAIKRADMKANADLAAAKGINPTLTTAAVLLDVAALAALIPPNKSRGTT